MGKSELGSHGPRRPLNLAGKRFGYLVVLRRAENQGRRVAWLCKCDCGEETAVPAVRLVQGRRKSCAKNGHKFRPPDQPGITVKYKSEYRSWENMHDRCQNPKHKNFHNYGGRGIKVCASWNVFGNFLNDMGKKPDPSYVIERLDVNGGYEPGNCKWIARTDQHRNRRNSIFVTYQGKKTYLPDLMNELGLSRQIVYNRLKLGWPLDVALALPVKRYKK